MNDTGTKMLTSHPGGTWSAAARGRRALDESLEILQSRKRGWARLPIAEKVRLLGLVRERAAEHAEEWVQAGAQLKGLPVGHPLIGAEEWLGGPYSTIAWLRDAVRTLHALDTGDDPLRGVRTRTTVTGQVAARVMPGNAYDRLLLNGYELEVWMQPGVTEAGLRDTIGSFFREADPPGRVTLVLGAGNVSAIPILDVLYSMVVHGDVVLLKMNPVNEAYGPVFEKVLAPLADHGYLQFAYGGGDVGAYLTRHELVEAVHITGSARTFDAIVWGVGEEAEQRKAAGTPLLAKPISSELGGVGPTIVLPGDWTDADIAYQAGHVATQRLFNAGHACVASQVLVLPAGWPLKERFLAAVRQALIDAPDRQSFYPGTDERVDAFAAENPDAELLPAGQKRALLVGIDPDSDHPAFRDEYFGPIYVTTELPGDTAEEFLGNAIAFANDRLHGSLSANLIVDPATERVLGSALERGLADMRFGCIAVNAWAGVVFLVNRAGWGAFPGNEATDIGSGSGVVHNSLMFDRPEKNVLHAPFRPFPRSLRHGGHDLAVLPPWFLSNRTGTTTSRRFTALLADPKPHRLAGILSSALRG